jgi:hypothetical protein
MTQYAAPGQPGSPVSVQDRYGNYVGGEFVPPSKGQYFENPSPINGRPFTEIARSTAEDVELALDAAHGVKRAWGRTSATERANVLNKIADRIEANLEPLAIAETWDNGKPVRETLAADLPLVVDHFRYYTGAIRALLSERVPGWPGGRCARSPRGWARDRSGLAAGDRPRGPGPVRAGGWRPPAVPAAVPGLARPPQPSRLSRNTAAVTRSGVLCPVVVEDRARTEYRGDWGCPDTPQGPNPPR